VIRKNPSKACHELYTDSAWVGALAQGSGD